MTNKKKYKTEDNLHSEIVAILTEAAFGVDDGYGGQHIGVFDDSFNEIASDIIKMIKSSFMVNCD